jgi:uncharacterized protein
MRVKSRGKRIAVVGSGIAGLGSAWLLSRHHAVTLFEAGDYLGGHTHTHDIELQGKHYAVDSGFIVYNPDYYPHVSQLFNELGVVSKPTTMSFSVRNEATGLEYNATTINTLFCQRRNIFSLRFLGMVRDLMRFYRDAIGLLDHPGEGPTLGEYLGQNGYGSAFRDEHLLPMASALWSSPNAQLLEFPARYLVQFMANHQMLRVNRPPNWRVVVGGSSSYVKALRARWNVDERLACPVRSVTRQGEGVRVVSDAGVEHFDEVVMACHSDDALRMLVDATDAERSVLGALPYQCNEAVLHTDASVMPRGRKAWAAWNAFVPTSVDTPCTVSYCMNLLQGIESPEPFIVTLNNSDAIDPAKVLKRMRYHHPVYSHDSVRAQQRKAEIQGHRHTWFAGAYWGWGFHEDGMRSAVEVAAALGVQWADATAAQRVA